MHYDSVFVGPGKGSPMTTNVVLVVVVGLLLLSDFQGTKLFHFTTDRG